MSRFLISVSLIFGAISYGAIDSNVLSGTWYVLAESQDLDAARCACTALELGDADGETHHVRLSCQRDGAGGSLFHLSGRIQVIDSATSSRLRIVFPFMGATEGNIVVFDPSYRYLVVVDDAGSEALVLSRTRELAPDQLQQALAALKQHAPQLSFSLVAQQGC